MDAFDRALSGSEQKYLQQTQQPTVDGKKTMKLLDETGSSIFNQQGQQPQVAKKTIAQKMSGMADKVGQFKRNQQHGGTVAAVATAQGQRNVDAPQADQNSLFTNQQPRTQQAQQQNQQQTQQPAPGGGQVDIQIQQQFNALPPEVKKAYGDNVQTYANIKTIEQKHNVT